MICIPTDPIIQSIYDLHPYCASILRVCPVSAYSLGRGEVAVHSQAKQASSGGTSRWLVQAVPRRAATTTFVACSRLTLAHGRRRDPPKATADSTDDLVSEIARFRRHDTIFGVEFLFLLFFFLSLE